MEWLLRKGLTTESHKMTNHKDRWPIICLTVVLLNNQDDDNLFTNGFILIPLNGIRCSISNGKNGF